MADDIRHRNEIQPSTETTKHEVARNGNEATETAAGVQVNNDENKDTEPNKYCKFVVSHTLTAFGVTLSLHIFMLIVTAVLLIAGYDILPIDFKRLPLDLQTDHSKLRTDAWWFVKDDNALFGHNEIIPRRSIQYQAIVIVYELSGGNIFTKQNLMALRDSEQRLLSNPQYQTKLCQLVTIQSHYHCKLPLSILRFFDGSYQGIDPKLYDPDFDDIATVLHTAQSNNLSKAILNFHLAKDASFAEKTVVSEYSRSLFYTGWPIDGFTSINENTETQKEKLNDLIVETFSDELAKQYEHGVGSMNVYYDNAALNMDAIEKQVPFDMMLAIASFVFIFLFVCFQTGSLWLTGWGVFSIISSFNITNLIYRVILDYRYIGVFHALSIFIILGIGSDDIFIFMDTWKQTSTQAFPTLAHRLSRVYTYACKTTFVTSLTTMVAFISNMQSPLLAVASFGLFSAMLIVINYISIIIFYPTVMTLHHKRRKGRCWCGPMCGGATKDSQGQDNNTTNRSQGQDNNTTNGSQGQDNNTTNGSQGQDNNMTNGSQGQDNNMTNGSQGQDNNTYNTNENRLKVVSLNHNNFTPRDSQELHNNMSNSGENRSKVVSLNHYVIQFLQGWFFRNIIVHKISRWVVIVIFLVFTTFTIRFAFLLEPETEQVQVWKPGTNWRDARDLVKDAFKSSQEDRVLVVHVIWGLNEQDRSACHHTDYKCKGKTVFDRSFDLNSPPCQNAMLEFCSKLKHLPRDQEDSLKLRRNQVTGNIEIRCIFERMNEYLEEESTKAKYPSGSDFSLPSNGDKITALLANNRGLTNVTLPNTYYRFFEIAAGYFITQGGSPNYTTSLDYREYKDFIGGDVYPHTMTNETIAKGNKYGQRLLYVAIAANTSFSPRQLGFKEGLKVHDAWETFVNNEMKDFPPACSNGFQATVKYYNIWHWLKIQKALVHNATTGIIVGLTLTLVILTLTTANVIVGFLATITIAMVTASVLGVISLVGWKLGLFESLNLTLIVGLAVDYVVHLAEGYMVLSHHDRLSRVRYTLGHVGISVFSGACTTLGASIFMLAAKIIFFAQFGIFIFCTIGFSILYSLFFFTTMLALIGPQGQTGSLKPLMRKITDFIRGKTKEHEDCATCKGKGFCKKNSNIGMTNTAVETRF